METMCPVSSLSWDEARETGHSCLEPMRHLILKASPELVGSLCPRTIDSAVIVCNTALQFLTLSQPLALWTVRTHKEPERGLQQDLSDGQSLPTELVFRGYGRPHLLPGLV